MSFWALLRPIVYLMLGLAMVIVSLTHRPAPESKLKLLEGIPEHVEVNKSSRHNKVHFNLGDTRTDYADDDPNYSQVLESISAKQPVKVWVDTQNSKDNYGHFYKMSVGDKPIVTYSETVEANKSSGNYQFWVGIILSLLGGYLLFKRLKA